MALHQLFGAFDASRNDARRGIFLEALAERAAAAATDREASIDVARVREMKAQGLGARAIAKAYEACAFAQFLKRASYGDCLPRSNRRKTYSDRREEVDVMWAGLRLIGTEFAEAGFCLR